MDTGNECWMHSEVSGQPYFKIIQRISFFFFSIAQGLKARVPDAAKIILGDAKGIRH